MVDFKTWIYADVRGLKYYPYFAKINMHVQNNDISTMYNILYFILNFARLNANKYEEEWSMLFSAKIH